MPRQDATNQENSLMFMWDRRPRLSFINHSRGRLCYNFKA